MPIRTIIDNTYYVFDSQGTALTWLAGARIAQIRIFAVTTAANVEFQLAAGTPWFTFSYLQTVAVNTGITLVPSTFTFPMGGVGVKTGIIPTTLTAATAWIDFV
mgnify:FL=1